MSSMKGQTLLYIPGDDINDPPTALKDKVSFLAVVSHCLQRCSFLQHDVKSSAFD